MSIKVPKNDKVMELTTEFKDSYLEGWEPKVLLGISKQGIFIIGKPTDNELEETKEKLNQKLKKYKMEEITVEH